MLKTTLFFLRHSLYPTKQALRLRLAPLHAYMLSCLILSVAVTLIDFVVLKPDFFIPMWLFLHSFSIFFFYVIWISIVALLVQLFTRVRMHKAWPYRHAWPYTVGMTVVPTVILVVLYHLMPSYLWSGFVLTILYILFPLFKIPLTKSQNKPLQR